MASDRRELLRIFALANEFKEGDLLVGGTRDESVRASARASLGAVTLGELGRAALVEDGVTEALAGSLDARLAAEIAHLTVGRAEGRPDGRRRRGVGAPLRRRAFERGDRGAS